MTFEQIKNKIDYLKTQSIKAEAKIEEIQKSWLEEFGTSDVEEVKKKIAELENDLEVARQQYSEESTKLENMLKELENA